MKFWLVKSEPGTYSWQQLVKDKKTVWDGVRNYAARNNLQAMKKGDLALFYHSMQATEVVGIARITKEHFQDPKTKEAAWVAVELAAYKALPTPVALADIKKDKSLSNMDLVRISRLSVGKVSDAEFFRICEMGGLDPEKL